MEEKNSIIFQIDSPLVKDVYENNPNYLIEFDKTQLNNTCAIYFCSNEIYYPNTEESFKANIIKKNKYEWYNTRIPNTYKHIFIRDIKKQWYLTGINLRINSPQLLLDFLRNETKGYTLSLVGSSAGGFASVLYGSLLKAERVFSFNGQFEIKTLLKSSSPNVDPIIFKYANDSEKQLFFDTKPIINKSTNIFYFHSANSPWDKEQYNHVKNAEINPITFISRKHGIPFPKCCLPVVLSWDKNMLLTKTCQRFYPLFFSFECVGFIKTWSGILTQSIEKIKKYITNY